MQRELQEAVLSAAQATQVCPFNQIYNEFILSHHNLRINSSCLNNNKV